MDRKELTPELQEKLKECKTSEELIELAKREGYELTDDELASISGGGWCPVDCGDLNERCPSLRDLHW